MLDDNGFPLDADNFSEEVEIEFIDPDEEDAAAKAKQPVEAVSGAFEAVSEASDGDEPETLRAELDRVRDVYLRKLAEFDNFRKRVEREREESRHAGAEDMITELLPVIDNFDRALQHAEDDSGAFREGVEMISKQLYDILDRRGMAEVNPVGQPFDPELHEAVQRVEETDHEPGTVAFVLLKGYTLGGKLIRPAMVGVAVESTGGNGGEAMS